MGLKKALITTATLVTGLIAVSSASPATYYPYDDVQHMQENQIISITEVGNSLIAKNDISINIKLGDVNGDRIINSADALAVLRHVSGGLEIDEEAADVIKDGKIDEDDAIYLLRHTIFPDQYPIPVLKKPKEINWGDVNRDGNKNSADAIAIIRYLNSRIDIDVDAADVILDGKIKQEDAIYLLRHTIMPDKYPIPCIPEAKEIKYGDVNGDGAVTSVDAVLVLRNVEYGEKIDEDAADVFEDGKIDNVDAHLILRYSIMPEQYPIPHSCGKYIKKYANVDEKQHDLELVCNCGRFNVVVVEEHEFGNGKCTCGATGKIYGDLNDDGRVTVSDSIVIRNWVLNGKEIAGKKGIADVFVDGKIDKMDSILIGKAILTKETLPHNCGSYTETINSLDDKRHNIVYKCACGKITDIEIANHDLINQKCACGYEKAAMAGDLNDDGIVNVRDLSMIRNILLGKEVEVEKNRADVFVDGKIDNMDLVLIRESILNQETLPHNCGSYTVTLKLGDKENHQVEYICKCGKITYEEKVEHELVNEKCECGYEKVAIIGDVNDDGKVNSKDTVILMRYLAGYNVTINKENADVFVDGKIEKMDEIVMMLHVADWDIEFPHKCGSYTVILKSISDKEHNVVYKCDCGEVVREIAEKHELANNKCACGYQEKIANDVCVHETSEADAVETIFECGECGQNTGVEVLQECKKCNIPVYVRVYCNSCSFDTGWESAL